MRIFFLYSLFLLPLISACNSSEKSVPLLDKTGELVVITVNSRDTYHKNYDDKYVGLEFDLVSEFVKELGKKIRFIVASDMDNALLILEKHQGHLATGISVTSKNKLRIRFLKLRCRIR